MTDLDISTMVEKDAKLQRILDFIFGDVPICYDYAGEPEEDEERPPISTLEDRLQEFKDTREYCGYTHYPTERGMTVDVAYGEYLVVLTFNYFDGKTPDAMCYWTVYDRTPKRVLWDETSIPLDDVPDFIR